MDDSNDAGQSRVVVRDDQGRVLLLKGEEGSVPDDASLTMSARFQSERSPRDEGLGLADLRAVIDRYLDNVDAMIGYGAVRSVIIEVVPE